MKVWNMVKSFWVQMVFRWKMKRLDDAFLLFHEDWGQMRPSQYYDPKTGKRYSESEIAEIQKRRRKELVDFIDHFFSE